MSVELPPSGLWNKQQAAAYLGIAVNTLNHWICDRKIVGIPGERRCGKCFTTF